MLALVLSRGIPRLAALCLFLAFTAFPSKQGFGENFEVPGDRAKTIGQAVDLAKGNSDTSNVIEVATGIYTESLTVWEDSPNLLKSLTIRAKEGAKVVIRASSDPLIQIEGNASDITLERLILETSGTGIQIDTSGRVTLRNLVITLASTAVACGTTASGTTINHVTFFQVSNGIACPSSPITVTNNIFSNISGTPIAPFSASGVTVQFNLFWACTGPTGERGSDLVEADIGDDLDPQFVDTKNDDFHLQEGSAAIDRTATTDEDVGAYGGLVAAASVPFPPAQPTVSCGDPDATTCKVTWKKNLDHKVGGYLLLTSAPAAPDPDYGPPTPVLNSGQECTASATECSVEVGSLPPFPADPAQPATPTAGFGNSKVDLSWPLVTNATEYNVFVETTPNSVTSGSVPRTFFSNSARIEPLSNFQEYFFSVQAVSRPQFFAGVKSVYGDVSGTVTIGVSDLSDPADPTNSQSRYGTARSGPLSGEVSATPQPVVGFPPLEDNGGCFIATAAYGSSLAPQVDVLRTFRERYLRPHPSGRAIIRVYETWSPPLAEVVRSSEVLRLVVRTMLWPIIGLAWMALHGSWWVLLIPGVVMTIVWFGSMRRRGAVGA